MTKSDDDHLKRAAAKPNSLADHYNWLKPDEVSEVAGELLFDEYDDGIPAVPGGAIAALSTEQTGSPEMASTADVTPSSSSLDFEEDIEDLIVFADDEDEDEDEFVDQ